MNEAPEHWQRQKTTAITAMLGVSLVTGIAITALAPNATETGLPLGIQLAANVMLFVLGFRWLQADSAQLDIRRPVWLNVSIVLLAAVFVPYYLFKTRPDGRRLAPILGFYGLIVGCVIATTIGILLMGGGQPPVSAPATF